MGRRRKDASKSVWDETKFSRRLEEWLAATPGRRVEDFCSEAGCSVSTVRRLGQPGQDPGIFLVSCVADVFGVKVQELTRKR